MNVAKKEKLGPFVGTFSTKVRKDGRIRLPKKIVPGARGRFRLFVVNEQCLRLFPEAGFTPDHPEQSAEKHTDCGTVDVIGGYLRVPREIRALVSKTGEAVIVGKLDAFEIFDRDVWTRELQEEQDKIRAFMGLIE